MSLNLYNRIVTGGWMLFMKIVLWRSIYLIRVNFKRYEVMDFLSIRIRWEIYIVTEIVYPHLVKGCHCLLTLVKGTQCLMILVKGPQCLLMEGV